MQLITESRTQNTIQSIPTTATSTTVLNQQHSQNQIILQQPILLLSIHLYLTYLLYFFSFYWIEFPHPLQGVIR